MKPNEYVFLGGLLIFSAFFFSLFFLFLFIWMSGLQDFYIQTLEMSFNTWLLFLFLSFFSLFLEELDLARHTLESRLKRDEMIMCWREIQGI